VQSAAQKSEGRRGREEEEMEAPQKKRKTVLTPHRNGGMETLPVELVGIIR
jgi:hypothetical protein